MGNCGDICGAVIGAIMAIGLVRKRSTNLEEWLETAEVAKAFRQLFQEETGALRCNELTKLDIASEEGREQLLKSNVTMTVCFPAVATAFRITMELLEKDQ